MHNLAKQGRLWILLFGFSIMSVDVCTTSCATFLTLACVATLPCYIAADLFSQRPTVSLQELHSSYMQTYNEQKERQQQLGQAAQQQDQQQPNLRPITPAQLQMAIAQLTDMVHMRGGILSRRQPQAPGGAAGAAAAAEINA
jgi:hypothetical protein